MPKKKKKILAIVIAAAFIVLTMSFLIREPGISFGEERKLPIYSVGTEEKKVAISFDAAWGDEFTVGILDILDEHEVKATFFLVKFWAEKYQEDVKEIFARGHDIGNHSSTHPDMASLSAEQIQKELSGTSQVIEKITGKKPTLFRPPFGSYSNTLIETCEAEGYKVIQWDVDSLDWKDIPAEQIVERVTRNVCPGSIVLFHNNASHVLTYLSAILDKLKADGYSVVKIDELIYHDNYHMDHTGRQVSGE